MKKNLSILFVVLIGLSLLLAACGGSASSAPSDPKAILGSWKADSGDQTFTFFDDGTLAIQTADGSATGTYTYDGVSLAITTESGSQTVTAQISGNQMTWSMEGSASSTFTKTQ